ncbi:polysaccharide lyase [Colwellia sp. MB02u-18]|nr:polysaccharide lyase [Colwellia sp. MB3u-45]MBA6269176.1 polysaccharide lyase [Colwellia sp. MB3u-43]MBA6322769.1 polysaccharide lyase [Colwellia sp. MB02u-19]MBA6323458.1 polysaccharide lyase [Colwellia sp. MB02u-18]MBA6332912.1 polysaccharide lyase [Colwellia sp. MB02u-12]MBA6343391.1 polysaccharide lyase [Colwellia sp. MB02u-1]
MRNYLYLLIRILLLTLFNHNIQASTPPIGKEITNTYVVDQQGNGDFISIQSAINATVNDKEVIIFIRPGKYNEKLFITRNNISLIGTSAKNTIIEYAELRSDWRDNHPSDWGAAVININASDVNIVNLSVINNYGRLHHTDEHQFAIRGFKNGTRIILHQCSVVADGADTLSLWNKSNGMYYHSYCHFEGHTDMVCPRGWALIENSTFVNNKQSATLWHDGELDPAQKLVVNNSYFDGVKGFWLGRHHYDAQFYIMNSQFSKNMANKPIFKKRYDNVDRIKPNLYGERYFFFNNRSKSPTTWTANNFNPTKNRLKDQSVESWVFEKQWYPNQVIAQLAKSIIAANFKADKLTKN